MIIGLSGKKQHGKDTVANMLQAIMQYQGDTDMGMPTWERKQFAGKLKEIVALLIGCTVKDLEDNNFKETPLGSEWTIYHLVDSKYNELIGSIYYSEEELREDLNVVQIDQLKQDRLKITKTILTPRRMLQLIGTECGRDIIHPNIWVNALFADYTQHSKWIITDVRFPNEAKAIQKKGGLVIRVNRNKRTSEEWQTLFPNIVVIDPDGWNRSDFFNSWHKEYITLETYQQRVMESTCRGSVASFENYFTFDNHPSETALDDYDFFNGSINNDSNLASLESQLHGLPMVQTLKNG